MDFAALILFLLLYYIRPQEWLAVIKPFQPVTIVMVFAIVATFLRTSSVSRKSLLRTPHDWVLALYFVWIIGTSPDRMGTFLYAYPLYLFYAVTVQVLDSMERIRRFLFWWAIMIFIMAGMAVISPYGFDPTGAMHRTMGVMRGRLSLGTSIFNNPNALGHGTVPVVLMLYFLLIWNRPIFVRIAAIPLFAIPLYCIYFTFSKGTYISGFASLVGALTFGRPKWVQLLIVFLAFTMGWAAIQTLPRMAEINDTKNDEAIQGRVQSFQFGLRKLETTIKGVGMEQFIKAKERETRVPKAAHSSYVQIGAELGRPGFYLYLSLLCCCLRTLVTARTRNVTEERVRRILFSMIIAFMVSSWMVDFAYRAAFFLFIGAISAFHRLLLKTPNETVQDNQTVQQALRSIPPLPLPGLGSRPTWAGPAPINADTITQTTLTIPTTPSTKEGGTTDATAEADRPGITWNRYDWRDVVFALLLMSVMLWIWRSAIEHF